MENIYTGSFMYLDGDIFAQTRTNVDFILKWDEIPNFVTRIFMVRFFVGGVVAR